MGKRRPQCGACWSVTRPPRQRRYPSSPESRRRSKLKTYGLSEEQYEAMLVQQGHVCAMCGGRPSGQRLAIDHCHGSGRVRALLCSRCNLNLGIYEAIRQAAEQYLSKYGQGNPLLDCDRNE
ncbi:endonuclease domain-containing protein [Streptomyces sp. NBC_01614]|uniref:endonuclease domain-containing protein n=1 Tax=Streptomyces sp. NBC_01614 TaxID=2975897 RepID=UPI00386A353D